MLMTSVLAMSRRDEHEPSIDPEAPYDSLPSFNGMVAINKASILDIDNFKEYVSLCNLRISFEEDNFFMVEGDADEINEFIKYWNYYTWVSV